MEDITKSEFESVFRQRYTQLYHQALHYLHDGEKAKDVVSEAFMAAWNRRYTVDLSKIDSYLCICVRNKCLTSLSNSRSTTQIEDMHIGRIADEGQSDWQLREQRMAEIEDVIKALPPKSRHVMEQCYYHRLSYKQVAEEMGITTDGVKKHIVKSMSLLRAHFNIIKDK